LTDAGCLFYRLQFKIPFLSSSVHLCVRRDGWRCKWGIVKVLARFNKATMTFYEFSTLFSAHAHNRLPPPPKAPFFAPVYPPLCAVFIICLFAENHRLAACRTPGLQDSKTRTFQTPNELALSVCSTLVCVSVCFEGVSGCIWGHTHRVYEWCTKACLRVPFDIGFHL